MIPSFPPTRTLTQVILEALGLARIDARYQFPPGHSCDALNPQSAALLLHQAYGASNDPNVWRYAMRAVTEVEITLTLRRTFGAHGTYMVTIKLPDHPLVSTTFDTYSGFPAGRVQTRGIGPRFEATLLLLELSHFQDAIDVLSQSPAMLLLKRAHAQAAPQTTTTHDGEVRYEWSIPDREHVNMTLTGASQGLQIALHRQNRKTRRALKPQYGPRNKYWATTAGITETDRRLADMASGLFEASRHRPMTAKETPRYARLLIDTAQTGRAVLMRPRREPLPLRWDPTPWQLELEVAEHEDNSLGVRVPEPPAHMLEVGSELLMISADGVVRHTDAYDAAGLLALMHQEIALSAVELFDLVDLTQSAPTALRYALSGDHDTLEPEAIVPRVRLAERGETLVAQLDHLYILDDLRLSVAHEDPTAELVHVSATHGMRVIPRDPDAEDHAMELFVRSAGRPPAAMELSDAVDFLADALPRLVEHFEILGQRELMHFRLADPVDTSTRFASGVDWFDIEVRFRAGKARIRTDAVLDAWRQGDRFVRLDSGELARLPEAWLAQHGHALEELDAMGDDDGHMPVVALPLAEQLLDDEAQASEDFQRWASLLTGLRGFSGIEDRALPSGLEADLRPYQEAGFRWLGFLRDYRLGGILADDMGLGKTVQAIAALAEVHASPDAPPSLVVAPTSVFTNWQRELARFAPGLRVGLYYGSGRDEAFDELDVVLTSYGTLRASAKALREIPFSYVILDEAQAIKNPTSQIANAARKLQADYRLALTGTPFENNLVELWSILHFLMPGFFGPLRGFRQRYANPIHQHQDTEALGRLRQRVRPFVLRRLKREVASELPPKTVREVRLEFSAPELLLYEEIRESYREKVLTQVDERGVRGSTIQVLDAIARLRQVCAHPRLTSFDSASAITESTKQRYMRTMVDHLIADGHRALVFSQWPRMLRILAEDLDRRQIDYLYLDGQTKRRQDLVDAWNQADGPPLFLISLKAGGTGLNLTAADHVFHLDPWWNPAIEDQATDRAHRIGQDKPVFVYKLIIRGTLEEKLLELQARKRELFEATIDSERLAVDELSRDDIVDLFRSE